MATLFSAQWSRAEGVPYFKGTVYDALSQAQRQHKMLIVEFYASWNYKSRWTNQNIIARKEVYTVIDNSFVLVQVDTQTKEGANLALQYEIKDYPAFVVFNQNGNVVDKIEVSLDRRDFIIRLDQILLENDGNSGWELSKIYLAAQNSDNALADKLAIEYISKKEIKKIISPIYWEMFANPSIVFYGSKTFEYVVKNRQIFDSVFTRKVVEEMLTNRMIEAIFPYSIGVKTYDSVAVNQIHMVSAENALSRNGAVDLMCELSRNRATKRIDLYLDNITKLLDLASEDLITNYITSLELVCEFGDKEQKKTARQLIEKYSRFNNSPSQLILIDELNKKLSE